MVFKTIYLGFTHYWWMFPAAGISLYGFRKIKDNVKKMRKEGITIDCIFECLKYIGMICYSGYTIYSLGFYEHKGVIYDFMTYGVTRL